MNDTQCTKFGWIKQLLKIQTESRSQFDNPFSLCTNQSMRGICSQREIDSVGCRDVSARNESLRRKEETTNLLWVKLRLVPHQHPQSILRLCCRAHQKAYPGINLLGRVPTFVVLSLKSPGTIRCYSVDKTWRFRRCLHHNLVLASFLYRAAGLVIDMC